MPQMKRDVFGSDKRGYEMYLFFKDRVKDGDEWDEDAYLLQNATVAEEIAKGNYVDGLQHYYDQGFIGLTEGPWPFQKREIASNGTV